MCAIIPKKGKSRLDQDLHTSPERLHTHTYVSPCSSRRMLSGLMSLCGETMTSSHQFLWHQQISQHLRFICISRLRLQAARVEALTLSEGNYCSRVRDCHVLKAFSAFFCVNVQFLGGAVTASTCSLITMSAHTHTRARTHTHTVSVFKNKALSSWSRSLIPSQLINSEPFPCCHDDAREHDGINSCRSETHTHTHTACRKNDAITTSTASLKESLLSYGDNFSQILSQLDLNLSESDRSAVRLCEDVLSGCQPVAMMFWVIARVFLGCYEWLLAGYSIEFTPAS